MSASGRALSEAARHRNGKLWRDFVDDTYPLVRRLALPKIPRDSKHFAVIIEPRQHPHLEYVLRNVMHFLGEGWGLQVFAGRQNADFVRQIVDGWGSVHLYTLDVDNLSRDQFRELRKSARYWRMVLGEQQLCFETDSILCRRGVAEFLGYDYVGAPWRDGLAVSDIVRVGNGGLSLRRKSAMIDICQRCHTMVIPSEDAFFSVHLHLNSGKYKVAPFDVASRFSVESVYYDRPVGVHKPWGYLNEAQFESLLSTIRYES